MATPCEGFKFHMRPSSNNFMRRGVFTWRHARDTLPEPSVFCKSCEFVRRFGTGEAVYACPGHDLSGSGLVPPPNCPETCRSEPQ